MLDGQARKLLDPWLSKMGRALAANGVSADLVTLFGLNLGVFAALAIAFGYYTAGLLFILLSRLADGLDGAVARATTRTDRGGYADIVADFAFYGLIPLAFIIANPEQNGLAGATLIFTFYVNGASFLAYAILAEKRGLSTDVRGSKSLYFTTGLAEAFETILVFCLFCLFPDRFPLIAYVFAAICLWTAGFRIWTAWREFA